MRATLLLLYIVAAAALFLVTALPDDASSPSPGPSVTPALPASTPPPPSVAARTQHATTDPPLSPTASPSPSSTTENTESPPPVTTTTDKSKSDTPPSVPSPDTEFIPISEWKIRKLHDIQQKIERYSAAATPTLHPQRRRRRRRCCRRARFVAALFTAPRRRCRPARSPVPDADPTTERSTSELIEVLHNPSPTTTVISPPQPPGSLLARILEASPEEVTGWTETGSISTSNAIRRVSDLVRAFKDVSTSLSAAQPGPPSSNESNASHVNATQVRGNGNATATNASSPVPTAAFDDVTAASTAPQQQLASPPPSDSSPSPSPTSKEKPFNFASADAGARLLAASDGTIGARNVLENNDDRYLLTACEGQSGRWVDVELSEEVIVERIQTGNVEYYSSLPKKVVLLSSTSYPPQQWRLLGMFQFANVRSLQMFRVERRLVSRYLRILYLGRQGHEFYCPISVVRAFGKNLIADWIDALEQKPSISFKPEATTPVTKEPDTTAPPVAAEAKADTREKGQVPAEKVHTVEGEPPPFSFSLESLGVATAKASGEPSVQSSGETNAHHIAEAESIRPSAMALEPDAPGMSEDDQIVLEAVHGDTLRTAPDNDNVFRKVTRMLKTLELNQTLTNQYIDTQLAKLVKAIQVLGERADEAEHRVVPRVLALERELFALRSSHESLRTLHWQKDLVCAAMLLVLSFAAGIFLTLLVNRSGATSQRLVGGTVSSGRSEREPEKPSLTNANRSVSSTELSTQLMS